MKNARKRTDVASRGSSPRGFTLMEFVAIVGVAATLVGIVVTVASIALRHGYDNSVPGTTDGIGTDGEHYHLRVKAVGPVTETADPNSGWYTYSTTGSAYKMGEDDSDWVTCSDQTSFCWDTTHGVPHEGRTIDWGGWINSKSQTMVHTCTGTFMGLSAMGTVSTVVTRNMPQGEEARVEEIDDTKSLAIGPCWI